MTKQTAELHETFFGDKAALIPLLQNADIMMQAAAFKTQPQSKPLRVGIVKTPGCYSGICGSAISLGLLSSRIGYGASVVVGNSVSAVENYLLCIMQEGGIGIYKGLIEDLFVADAKSKKEILLRLAHREFAHRTNAVSNLVWGPLFNVPHIMNTGVARQHFDPFKAQAFKMFVGSPIDFRSVSTNRRTGEAIITQLRETRNPDEALEEVIASTLVPVISSERIKINGVERCDGIFSNIIAVDAAEDCDAIIVISNRPSCFYENGSKKPDEMDIAIDMLRQYGPYQEHRTLGNSFHEAKIAANIHVRNIIDNGFVITGSGKKIPAAMICPPPSIDIKATEQRIPILQHALLGCLEVGFKAARELQRLHAAQRRIEIEQQFMQGQGKKPDRPNVITIEKPSAKAKKESLTAN